MFLQVNWVRFFDMQIHENGRQKVWPYHWQPQNKCSALPQHHRAGKKGPKSLLTKKIRENISLIFFLTSWKLNVKPVDKHIQSTNCKHTVYKVQTYLFIFDLRALITSPRPRTVREPMALGTSFFFKSDNNHDNTSSIQIVYIFWVSAPVACMLLNC